MPDIPLTLALNADVIQLVIYGVVGLFVFGGWVAKLGKKLNEPAQRGNRPSPSLSLEEMAARRRARLQQMSGQRSGSATPRPPQPAQPTNMTLAEASERARAQKAYEARAAQLRQQTQRIQAAQSQQAGRSARARTPSRPARRSLAPTPARPVQTAPVTMPRPVAPTATAQPITPASIAAHALSLGSDVTQVSRVDNDRDIDYGESVVHRHVTDAGTTSAGHHVGSALARGISLKTLRQAIVLKEVLEPPLALREEGRQTHF
ncbi:MAG: hypothetical protein GC164_00280 [Phycisphaera sp.]|nr:hypothetical protein [Phycisphaera sp.]